MRNKALSEQVAIVTGGGSGIGRAFAAALAAAGTKVVIASRRAEVVDRTAAELNSILGAEHVFSYGFDLLDADQTPALVAWVLDRFGSIDLLINNSGLAIPESVVDITDGGWETVLETNVGGAMRLVRAVYPHMLGQDFGDVVNVSSQAGKHGYADVPSYCASKFALLGFAESLRDDIRKRQANIRVFNFCPGLVDVDHVAENDVPRADAIHVSNMAKTLMYALSLDRDVVLEDISLYKK